MSDRDGVSVLNGLPSLRRCQLSLHSFNPTQRAYLFVSPATFQRQCDRLQEITLRGTGGTTHLAQNTSWLVGLTALRSLVLQDLGLAEIQWFLPRAACYALRSLVTLDLDGNSALQLSRLATAELLRMPAFKNAQHAKAASSGEHTCCQWPERTQRRRRLAKRGYVVSAERSQHLRVGGYQGRFPFVPVSKGHSLTP